MDTAGPVTPKRSPRPKRYRKPNEGALHARLTPELAEEFRVWLARTAPKHKYMYQKMGMEGFLIMIAVAAMERLDPREVDRILDDARPHAEAYEHEWNRAQAALEAGQAKAEMKASVSHSKDVPAGKTAGKRRRA